LVTTTRAEAQVLSVRLAAEGVICEVRGPSGVYPVGAAKVFVLQSDLQVAHALLDDVQRFSRPDDDAERGLRRHPPVVVAIAVVVLAMMIISLVGGAIRAFLIWAR
jgi:hypothetical protein